MSFIYGSVSIKIWMPVRRIIKCRDEFKTIDAINPGRFA